MPDIVPLRYVILHHTGIPDPHYDLMFETTPNSALATWRSPTWPITEPTYVTPLPDHRTHYLTYEGPVSQNRGQVTRIASGHHHSRRPTSGPAEFTLDDQTKLTFAQDASGRWLCTPVTHSP